MSARAAIAFALALAGCAGGAPCDGKAGVCVNVLVKGPGDALDALGVQVTLPGGGVLRGDSGAGVAPIVPPVQFALLLPDGTSGKVVVDLSGEQGTTEIESGSGKLTVPPSGQTLTIDLERGAPDASVPRDLSVRDAAPPDAAAPPDLSVVKKTLSFAQAMNYPAGIDPYAVAIADLDGDGKNDLAVADYGAGAEVLLRKGASFAAPVNYGAGGGPDWEIGRASCRERV